VIVHSGLMLTAVPRMLLTGPPRAGKTTLVGRLAGELAAAGVAVGGFVTREIREDGERAGFTVEEIGGSSALLAHVALPEGPMVGRYHVDVAAFEGLALPAIQRAARRGGVVIIDELGQMELFSPAFISSFSRLLGQAIPLAATIHARQHPVTDAIKQRSDIELLEVRPGHADELLTYMISRLSPQPGSPPSPD
jgi:nucleoside-triphosphatase